MINIIKKKNEAAYDVSNMTHQEIYKLLWPSQTQRNFHICTLQYKGVEIDSSYIEEQLFKTNVKLGYLHKLKACKAAQEAGIPITEYNLREIYNVYEKSLKETDNIYEEPEVDKEILQAGLANLKQYGYLQYIEDLQPCSLEMQEATKQAFKNCEKNNGRLPKIWQSIAWICENYHMDVNKVAKNFNVPTIQKLLKVGLSGAEAVLVCNKLKPEQVDRIANASPGVLFGIVSTLSENLEVEPKWQIYIEWLTNHIHTNSDLVEKVFDYVDTHDVIQFQPSTSVMGIQQIMSDQRMMEEVEKIEFAYELKLKDCVCELKPCTIANGRYKAEILKGNDPKQVMLGYDTFGYQHFNGFGESAMIHGLANPKAGFFVITDQFTGKVYAQGEIWEENEDTLVFNNLEFANDMNVENYREVIGEWLKALPYPNCKIGMGYNQMENNLLEQTDGVYPIVTAEEYCILKQIPLTRENISWAESQIADLAQKNQLSDIVCCDSKTNACIMKKNGEVSLYFRPNEQEKETAIQNDNIKIEK